MQTHSVRWPFGLVFPHMIRAKATLCKQSVRLPPVIRGELGVLLPKEGNSGLAQVPLWHSYAVRVEGADVPYCRSDRATRLSTLDS